MANKQTLGRGLDALIPKDIDVTILDEDKNRVQKLLINEVLPNPDQPRRQHDQTAHKELASSIKQHGVLQPIIVVKQGGQYRIVAGERRWRAAKDAGLTEIPAIVRSLEELEQVELALIENIQRVDLSPLEQALAVYKLQHQFNLELEKIADKLGKAPSTVSNLARLLQLPDAARQALSEGRISEGHARAVLALREWPNKQTELLESILNNNWTVRQAEQYVVATKKGAAKAEASSHTASDNALTKRLSQKTGQLVKIKHTAHGGQLIIHFANDDELQKITKILGV